MLTVIAAFPSKENEKDGMFQRVSAIDSLMKNVERVYIDIAIRRYTNLQVEKAGSVTIYRLNALLHYFKLAQLLRQSSTVYVHSAYNALKILPFLTRCNVIFDAHGIVPEELELEGHPRASKIVGFAERLAVRHCSLLICVTQRMREHYEKKYGRHNEDNIVLPILPHFERIQISRADVLANERDPEGVIYAGGLQSWQNIDKMVDAALRRQDMKFTFLTGEIDRLKEILDHAGLKKYDCLAVSPSAVKDYYLTHTYGFILRDEIAVNEVACPTKLIEYLFWGVIPIVITPRIGDFDGTTISCVDLRQFLNGDMPTVNELRVMRAKNRQTLDVLISTSELARERLVNILRSL